MLFKQKDLFQIQEGKIKMAFRKWKRANVKKGTLLKTAIGQLEILDISKINPEDITKEDAIQAGYANLASLEAILNNVDEGDLYKIHIAYHSPDPRIALRNQTSISDTEWEAIRKKLNRMDARSKDGPWTLNILKLIADNPRVRAKDLAEQTGKTKDWLKPNIRKLKNMGLTISHHLGYEISPRGKTVIYLFDSLSD